MCASTSRLPAPGVRRGNAHARHLRSERAAEDDAAGVSACTRASTARAAPSGPRSGRQAAPNVSSDQATLDLKLMDGLDDDRAFTHAGRNTLHGAGASLHAKIRRRRRKRRGQRLARFVAADSRRNPAVERQAVVEPSGPAQRRS